MGLTDVLARVPKHHCVRFQSCDRLIATKREQSLERMPLSHLHTLPCRHSCERSSAIPMHASYSDVQDKVAISGLNRHEAPRRTTSTEYSSG